MQGIDQNEMLESCFECLDLRVLTLYFSQLKIILRFFGRKIVMKDCVLRTSLVVQLLTPQSQCRGPRFNSLLGN